MDGYRYYSLFGNIKPVPVLCVHRVIIVVANTCIIGHTAYYLTGSGEIIVRLCIVLFTTWGEVVTQMIGAVAAIMRQTQVVIASSSIG